MEPKKGWLIIWRRVKESILIGDEIEISVSKIKDGQVWLAVRTPYRMKVIRVDKLDEPNGNK